ncbi:MAG: alpha/beta fold hydrolase [Flavobacterium sp.]|nr:alpha/beta fold hydrolase [Flavobacterium sp.]
MIFNLGFANYDLRSRFRQQILLLLVFVCLFCSAQETESLIDSGNTKLHFRTFGTGKPILIINGGPGMDSNGFEKVAQDIAQMNYQTIIYDQRGTGKSTLQKSSAEAITMDLMVEDIENLRHHLKIEKWTILGHSFGGIMAAYYASKHPEIIDKLIFSSSGGVNLKFMNYVQKRLNNNLTTIERDSLNFYQRKREAGDNSQATIEKRAHFLAKAYVFDKSKSSAIAQRMTTTNYTINSLVFQNLQKIQFDCSNSFYNFKQPVLILQGKNDIISVETAQEIAKAFPNSKLILMEKCGHYGWIDANELYYNSINKFLNNQ